MPFRIELNEAERLTLEELSRNPPCRDFRPRALGRRALGTGHGAKVVADSRGVREQPVYHWQRGWREGGVRGLLNGHPGGRPLKLTVVRLNTAEAVARAEPCSLHEIARRVREAPPAAPGFSRERLAAGLKARGWSWKRTRLSLQKSAARRGSPPPQKP